MTCFEASRKGAARGPLLAGILLLGAAVQTELLYAGGTTPAGGGGGAAYERSPSGMMMGNPNHACNKRPDAVRTLHFRKPCTDGSLPGIVQEAISAGYNGLILDGGEFDASCVGALKQLAPIIQAAKKAMGAESAPFHITPMVSKPNHFMTKAEALADARKGIADVKSALDQLKNVQGIALKDIFVESDEYGRKTGQTGGGGDNKGPYEGMMQGPEYASLMKEISEEADRVLGGGSSGAGGNHVMTWVWNDMFNPHHNSSYKRNHVPPWVESPGSLGDKVAQINWTRDGPRKSGCPGGDGSTDWKSYKFTQGMQTAALWYDGDPAGDGAAAEGGGEAESGGGEGGEPAGGDNNCVDDKTVGSALRSKQLNVQGGDYVTWKDDYKQITPVAQATWGDGAAAWKRDVQCSAGGDGRSQPSAAAAPTPRQFAATAGPDSSAGCHAMGPPQEMATALRLSLDVFSAAAGVKDTGAPTVRSKAPARLRDL